MLQIKEHQCRFFSKSVVQDLLLEDANWDEDLHELLSPDPENTPPIVLSAGGTIQSNAVKVQSDVSTVSTQPLQHAMLDDAAIGEIANRHKIISSINVKVDQYSG